MEPKTLRRPPDQRERLNGRSPDRNWFERIPPLIGHIQ
jgi:hypothetical protein